MARFIFKLEPVLKQRKLIEDQAQRQLALLMRQQMILKTQIRSLQQTIAEDKQQMAQSLSGHVDVAHIRRHGAHSHRVSVRVQEIVFKLMELNSQIEQGREVLIKASRERKAVEMLREKQFKRWQQEQNRIETNQLDEFATQSYIRRTSNQWGAVA